MQWDLNTGDMVQVRRVQGVQGAGLQVAGWCRCAGRGCRCAGQGCAAMMCRRQLSFAASAAAAGLDSRPGARPMAFTCCLPRPPYALTLACPLRPVRFTSDVRLPFGRHQHRDLHRSEPPLCHHLGCGEASSGGLLSACTVGSGWAVVVRAGCYRPACSSLAAADLQLPDQPHSGLCRRQDDPHVGVRHPGAGQVHCG